ncbi:hypothetical protein [Sulfurimonas sp. HSL-1716]|uniref:hypothetical protein n=1 Tax=Hydrocurvibacter sulfurireducens TaxID=3131937 RepID=UPI0031F9B5D0
MSKKISVTIGGKRFDLNIDDKFASFLHKQMALDLNVDGNNEVKRILEAYVRKTYELYTKEQKVEEILKKFD